MNVEKKGQSALSAFMLQIFHNLFFPQNIESRYIKKSEKLYAMALRHGESEKRRCNPLSQFHLSQAVHSFIVVLNSSSPMHFQFHPCIVLCVLKRGEERGDHMETERESSHKVLVQSMHEILWKSSLHNSRVQNEYAPHPIPPRGVYFAVASMFHCLNLFH